MTDSREIVLVASLLASRLCHDLVNPVGALNTGIEVLDGEQDAEMREHAMSLIRESTQKTVALLTFARSAFGASGSWEGQIEMREARELAEGFYAHVKAGLDWQVSEPALDKPMARVLLNLLLIAERCVPRAGSQVTAEAGPDRVQVTARGRRAKLGEDLSAALGRRLDDLEAKASPAYLAALLMEAIGGSVTAEQVDEETVVFTAQR